MAVREKLAADSLGWAPRILISTFVSVVGVYAAISVCMLFGFWGNMMQMAAFNLVAAVLFALPNYLPFKEMGRRIAVVSWVLLYAIVNIVIGGITSGAGMLWMLKQQPPMLTFDAVVLVFNLLVYPVASQVTLKMRETSS